MTQQMVDLTARLRAVGAGTGRAAQRSSPTTALASVAGNVDTAKQRLTFADQNISQRAQPGVATGRTARPGWSMPSARRSRRWARHGHCWTPSTARRRDINRAVATLPSAIADIQNGIKAAGDQLAQGNTAHGDELSTARDAAVKAVADAQSTGTADPLGAFTKLTEADADLDRLLASVAEEREAAERLSRAFDQALFTAQSRVRAVSDYIDVRRGSVGAGGSHPARRSSAPAAGRAGQASDQPDRGHRARQRRGDAGVTGAVDGRLRCSSGTAVVLRAIRQQQATPTWARCSAASFSATSSAGRCAADWAAAWAAAGASTSYGGSGSWTGGGGRF